MPRLPVPFLALALLAPASCGYEEPDMPSQEALYDEPWRPNDFFLQGSGGHVVHATIGEGTAIGPVVNVGLYAEDDAKALRGLVLGKTLSASVRGAEVEGLWGAEPLRLRMTRMEKRLHVEGLLRGRITDLWIGPEAITGTVGLCGFDLARRGHIYEGSLRCGGSMELVSVRVPETFATWGETASAAMVAMLLTG
ncbi:hypothetical protein [Polyangium sp. 6x1]|uniref:hypothetical protein n=1 Tax=Polyangium sp. 6x1 TaxID=3042689 RepID=UPI00248234DC|nr:hypothetical protein [Polyangium sp. 6x1]